ncbi:uncharacterized protein LOC111638023 [Centruroides sculpturatus]|uniref:uncharacterized protein LOC111638023 n=1 Tax=Centruroides sculpturatus TaxID=218467 RepID=UPI000C6D167D|nr:uncharacterized protein LOC111638023 [Centruroides sculpturatus]
MSTGNFQQNNHSLPTPSSTPSKSNTPTSTSNTISTQIEGQGLRKDIRSSPSLTSGQSYVMLPPHSQAQQGNLPQNIISGADYFQIPYGSRHQNLYLFSGDGNTVTSQSLEGKESEKVGTNMPSRVINNNPARVSPKSFASLQINDSKNDKMISGYDRQIDGLSPLSVIAVSNYSDVCHSSPSLTSSGLTQSQQALRYQAGNDAMLSAINYTESDMLQEGGFDVPVTSTFGNLDGLLNSIGGGVNASSMRLPDLLDGDGSQEPYIDTAQDLQLSPESFTTGAEGFSVENSSLNRITESGAVDCTDESTKPPDAGSSSLPDKLRGKGRPVKATSPSRPGTQPCPTCGKVFSNSSALTKHKLTHSDERKYVCQLCTKAFKRQDHLNGHMLTHRNKKPYECDVEGCGKSYCDARSLRRHKENHHSNSCSTGNISIPSVGSHLAMIPGMTHLGFTSLQSSFPTSVITTTNDQIFSESTENNNRIQYVQTSSVSSQSVSQSDFTQENNSSVEKQMMNSVASTASSQLQFLAFHQQPHQQFQPQIKSEPGLTSSVGAGRTEGRTVLTPWHPQTINTSALLLAQNFGSPNNSQPTVCQSQNNQLNISESLDSTTDIRSRASPSSVKKQQTEIGKQGQEESQSDTHSHDSQQQKLPSPNSDSFLSSPIAPSTSQSSNEATFSCSQLPAEHNINIGISSDNVFRQHSIPLNQSLLSSEISLASNNELDNVVTSVTNTGTTETEQSQINSPLLQQLLTPPQHLDLLQTSGNDSSLSNTTITRAALLQHALFAPNHHQSLQQGLFPNWNQVSFSFPNASSNSNSRYGQEPKPVECNMCQRRFKNIPALNGHMRLHGGYFKKENDVKKPDRKQLGTSQNPPLQTASTNVRALIEEKIIQKRTSAQASSQILLDTMPLDGNFFQTSSNEQNMTGTSSIANAQFVSNNIQSPALSPVSQDNSLFSNFPVTSQNNTLYDISKNNDQEPVSSFDWQKQIHELKEDFRVPHPPAEKLRRHSDSDHFIPSKRPCPNYTRSALADLLRKKVVAKRTSRTGSDPGEPLLHAESPQTNSSPSTPSTPVPNPPSDLTPHIQFSNENPLSLVSNQNLSALQLEESDLPMSIEEEMIKSSNSDVCLSSSVLSSVNHLPTNLSILDNDSKKHIDNSQWSCNLPLHFFGSEIQPTISAATITSVPSTVIGSTSNCVRNRSGEDSNDDDVFLSPVSLPTSPLKIKRKHRPEPLYIPPYVNNCGFTSRLRSPRLWDPSNPENKNASPPPYTPPPMLSPVRSGSGLFWHIITSSGSLTPKSAPITPNFSLLRKSSINEPPPEEEELSEAPETDILPHVNIGSQFQARLPHFNSNKSDALKCEDKADKVWDPVVANNLLDEEVETYLELSCSSVVPGNGKNKEYALHVLHLAQGNIQEAILQLMNPAPTLPAGHPLLTYHYPETDKWTPEDIETYHQLLIRNDKDFFSIAQEMQSKSVKQCVQFYYIWKKVCPEEYKRLRLIRRRREQQSQENMIYVTRNQTSDCTENEKGDVQEANDREMQFSDTTVTSGNGLVISNGASPVQNTGEATNHSSPSRTANGSNFIPIVGTCDMPLEPLEEFPCKICGKIFNKVKSRSAHMKSHRQTEAEKKNKFEC